MQSLDSGSTSLDSQEVNRLGPEPNCSLCSWWPFRYDLIAKCLLTKCMNLRVRCRSCLNPFSVDDRARICRTFTASPQCKLGNSIPVHRAEAPRAGAELGGS